MGGKGFIDCYINLSLEVDNNSVCILCSNKPFRHITDNVIRNVVRQYSMLDSTKSVSSGFLEVLL